MHHTEQPGVDDCKEGEIKDLREKKLDVYIVPINETGEGEYSKEKWRQPDCI